MGWMTEERLMIQESCRNVAMQEVLPVANRLDPVKGDIPRELIVSDPIPGKPESI
jgi:hypothetical protein